MVSVPEVQVHVELNVMEKDTIDKNKDGQAVKPEQIKLR